MNEQLTTAKYATREEWLQAATEKLQATFTKAKATIVPVKISCGWPSARGLAKNKKTIGQCWDGKCAADGKPQIFISPCLDNELHFDAPDGVLKLEGDCMGVLPTLAHELVHAIVGCDEGHGKVFGKLARGIGLEGKMTSTHAGATLAQECFEIAKILGPYPHVKINPLEKGGPKPQKNRQIKCECGECGYVARTTRKWLEEVGAPHCPKHGEMQHDPIDPDDSDDEGGEDND